MSEAKSGEERPNSEAAHIKVVRILPTTGLGHVVKLGNVVMGGGDVIERKQSQRGLNCNAR